MQTTIPRRKIKQKHTQIPKSMFGTVKGMKKWDKEEDRLHLHEL
jgi:hypothetical protein